VSRDVPDFGLVVGVPAKRVGWMGRAGRPLELIDGAWVCPETGERYMEVEGILQKHVFDREDPPA
jgi:hypothetical protein